MNYWFLLTRVQYAYIDLCSTSLEQNLGERERSEYHESRDAEDEPENLQSKSITINSRECDLKVHCGFHRADSSSCQRKH